MDSTIKDDLFIFCINLKESVNRRDRMIQRFRFHHLLDQVTFIEGVSKNDPLIDFYCPELLFIKDDPRRPIIGCLGSHLKAIKRFLQSDKDGAIVCEDDILPHNNFLNLLQKILSNKPDDATLISLGYIIVNWINKEGQPNFPWSGKDSSLKDLCKIHLDHTWGTQMYWISRKYGQKVIKKYDHPHKYIKGYTTSETIVRFSKGLISYPPLAIEDAVESLIRDQPEMEYHIKVFGQWDYFKYADCEEGDHISPLYHRLTDREKKEFKPKD